MKVAEHRVEAVDARGVRANTAQAGRWLLQACLAGAGGQERCLEAGLAAAQPGSGQKVQPILGPLCDTGEVRACNALAPIMDISQRVPLYRRACELGDQRACAQVPGAVPATAAPVVAAVEAAATSETTQAPTNTETRVEETTQPSSALIPAMSAQEAAEETAALAEQARVQAEQAQRHAEAQQREAEQAAQAAQRREGQAQVRAAQAAAQEAIERKRADEATARETTAKEEAMRASERESSAREEARQAGEREVAAQQRAREGEAAERASAERLRAAEERRDEQAQLKAARERTERKAREIRDTEVEPLALACEAGHVGSCEGAGLRLRDGINTTADPQRALRLFETACLAGSTSGCTDAIPLLTPTTVAEQPRLLRLHEGACTNGPGNAVACQRAMDFLLTSDAEKAPPLVAATRGAHPCTDTRACMRHRGRHGGRGQGNESRSEQGRRELWPRVQRPGWRRLQGTRDAVQAGLAPCLRAPGWRAARGQGTS